MTVNSALALEAQVYVLSPVRAPAALRCVVGAVGCEIIETAISRVDMLMTELFGTTFAPPANLCVV